MVDITFKGEFKFSDKTSLKDALNSVRRTLEKEDKGILKTWKASYRIKDLNVIIDISIGCPQDDFWAYESIIESLADQAIDGSVEGWRDDYPDGDKEVYKAGTLENDIG